VSQPTRVWFNKGFSVLEHIVRNLGQGFTSIVSHSQPDSPSLEVASEGFLEPKALLGEAYLEYCLDKCREYQVEVFVPAKLMAPIWDARARFEANGTRVLTVADGATLRHLDRKAEFLESFDMSICPIPEFRVFRTLEEFDSAVLELKGPELKLCFKPSRGIYGHGFRVLTDRESLKNLLSGDMLKMSYERARAVFASAEFSSSGLFEPMLLMHYCEGVERSIDALAYQGKLMQAVVRRKDGEGVQMLEESESVLEIAEKLAHKYNLSGVFNFQLKEKGGVPQMLEINARPSGGLFQAMTAPGFNPMRYNLLLHLGLARENEIPPPRVGMRVAVRSSACVLEERVPENPVPENPVPENPVLEGIF